MKKIYVIIILSLFTAISAKAQTSNNDLLKKLIDKNILSKEEADELSDQDNKPVNNKIREAFNSPYIRFGGYGMLMHNYNDTEEIKHRTDLRVLFISMTGQFNKFRYFVLTEFVNPMVYEFYGEWAPDKAIKLKGGMMKVPYSLENQMSLTDIETVFNTRSVSNLIGMGGDVMQLQNGINNTGRDIGLQLHGKLFNYNGHELIQYSAGIFQGSGIKLEERNNTKDFSASLMFCPTKKWRIGGSSYMGETNYILPSETMVRPHVRNRWLVSSDYNSERFYARSEWINANDGGIKKEALYGTVLYYVIPQKLNVVAKVDYLNNNKDINSEVIDYTAGVNYYFYRDCRLQLNYTYSDYNKARNQTNSNAVVAQMQIVF